MMDMRSLEKLVLGTFLLVLVSALPARSQTTVFTHVNLVPMDTERVVEDQSVVVEGDRIIKIGDTSSVEIPEGALVIDGSGKYLMPGLAEMHGHIPPPSESQREIENVLFLYAANGITTVRGMLGYPGQLTLKEAANSGELISPTLYLAGPSFNGNTVTSPEQAAARVRTQKEEGWDLLKIHPGLSRDQYDAIAETAREVGITFGGHVPAAVGLEHALEQGQETFDHLDGFVEYLDGGAGPVNMVKLGIIVGKTIRKGAWVVPTMALWETLQGTVDLEELQSYDELKYRSASSVRGWSTAFRGRINSAGYDPVTSHNVIEARRRVLEALSNAGARILMGTDAPQQFSVPGFSLHRELIRMVEAGMTPFEVLQTGTRNVGEYFAHQDTFGLVAVGHRADLVLVNENPLTDVKHIAMRSGVMIRGHWYSNEEIQARLDTIETYYKNRN